jgi:hypothetical protein
MKLSILTPSIPERIELTDRLRKKIERQIGDLPIEHLILLDNKKRSIGEKRQALLDSSIGEYFAFVDDDDDIASNYVAKIMQAIRGNPDVITFKQKAIYNGLQSEVIFKAEQHDQPFNPNGQTLRGPWHVCAWKKSAVIGCQFGFCNYGEDLIWAMQARRRIQTTIHIDAVLHTYQHDAKTTAAPETLTS